MADESSNDSSGSVATLIKPAPTVTPPPITKAPPETASPTQADYLTSGLGAHSGNPEADQRRTEFGEPSISIPPTEVPPPQPAPPSTPPYTPGPQAEIGAPNGVNISAGEAVSPVAEDPVSAAVAALPPTPVPVATPAVPAAPNVASAIPENPSGGPLGWFKKNVLRRG